jgi:hypothetical protein
MDQQPSWAAIARQVLFLMLWATRRLLRVVLRRPILDVLLLLLALYFIASLLGSVNRPRPILYEAPIRHGGFEGR